METKEPSRQFKVRGQKKEAWLRMVMQSWALLVCFFVSVVLNTEFIYMKPLSLNLATHNIADKCMAQCSLCRNRTSSLSNIDGSKQPPLKMVADKEETNWLESVILSMRERRFLQTDRRQDGQHSGHTYKDWNVTLNFVGASWGDGRVSLGQ